MAAGRHLGFDVTRNSAIRSADPENPTLEPNMKTDHPLQRCGHSRILGAYGTPILGEGEVIWVSDGTSVGIDLTEWGGQMSKCLEFCPGIDI